jgi:uncharacterized repeat protein (TIGR01451 family)
VAGSVAVGGCVALLAVFSGQTSALARTSSALGAEGIDVLKAANVQATSPGDTLTYTIAVTDSGSAAGTVRMTDTLQAELNYVTDSLTATIGTFGVAGDVLTWTADMVGGDEVALITFTASISPEATINISNSAVVTGGGETVTGTVETVVSDVHVFLPLLMRSYWKPYHDDFTDSGSGWSVRRSDDSYGEDADYKTRYIGGNLYTLLVGRYDFSVTSPLAGVSAPYTITTRVRVVSGETIDGVYYAPKHGETYGIVFGGNSSGPCPANRYTPAHQGCLSHYYRLLVVWSADDSSFLQWNLKRIDMHDPANDGKELSADLGMSRGSGVSLIGWTGSSVPNANGWNEWRIVVSESAPNITVYLNGAQVGQASDTTYIYEPAFGFFNASPEYGAVGYEWDWFDVSP